LVKIEVYFSPVCPHCPGAKKLVAEVAARYDGEVDVEEVNTYTAEGIKRGMANEVMSVPTVIIDSGKRIVGFPFQEQDLVSSIEDALARQS
jgi:small redox-active disulfide protein 1